MKAVVYHGPRNVSVDEVPDAKIEKPTDALVRITATNICGSDLHMYEGRTDFEEGRVFGHENVGEVIGVGDAVDKIKVGDMISAPFNVACGHCRNCEEGLTNYCLRANRPGIAGAAYGFADMGPWQGGQAELLRLPWADFNCLRLPEDAREKQDDYVMLSDIFPTGWHAVRMSGLRPGETIVIYGSGPVGCMAALSATTMGASKVMVVDRHPDRLRLAGGYPLAGGIAVHESCGVPDDAVDWVTRAVGVQLHEHVTERGKADHGLFSRRRVAFGRLGQRPRDSTFARVARPPPDGNETESELPASVLSLLPHHLGTVPDLLCARAASHAYVPIAAGRHWPGKRRSITASLGG